MTARFYYRGGSKMSPDPDEVRVDRLTGLLKTTHGLSVYDRPDHPNLARHGGAHRLGDLPDTLRIIQRGRDPAHHEVVPAGPMTFEDFEEELGKVTLTPIP